MKFSSKFKKAAFGLTAITASLIIGMTAACSQKSPEDEDDEKVTTREDVQDIKNGNFEFYDDNEGLYPISTPDNWSYSYSGTSSSSLSGVIKTSKEGWDYLTDPTLPATLKANDDLKSDDKEKKDYNGALADDMLYKNMHDALDSGTSDDDKAEDEKKAYIENPNTHNLRWDEATEKYVYTDNEGKEAEVYTKDGKVYTDSEYKNEVGTSVLMVHNYRNNYYRGTEGYFNSSTKLTLEANTACKISLWVKTAELYCDNSKNERTEVTFNKGAYIKVDTSVGGNDLDSFIIRNINTEILNPDEKDGSGNVTKSAANNGWVQYTVYVQSSSFASTTVNLTLGLGENGSKGINTVEGYAFFDDITYEKYFDLESLKKENADFETAIRESDEENNPANTCYPLAADAKTSFRVDVPKYQTEGESGEITSYTEENNANDRKFFINFASTEANPLEFNANNVKAGLTVDSEKYISSKNKGIIVNGISTLDNGAAAAKLPNNLKNDDGLTVKGDLLAVTPIGNNWTSSFVGFDYNELLTKSLASAASLPGVGENASTLIMLSANRAAYEARITDDAFSVADGEYKVLSFWLKTSDFNGKTAATISVYDPENEDETNNFTLDTTTQTTTDFDGKKDVYDGWIRCFVRVGNTSGKEGAKKFALKVNLGLTSIKGTSATDYNYGWLALTNLSVMDLNEDVYGYTSSLSNKAELTFNETNESFSKPFDSEQGGTSNQIKTDLANPSSYTGANGASVSVKPTGSAANDYDTTNNNEYAGLLNRENIANYDDKSWAKYLFPNAPITNEMWDTVVGRYTYQPLLIVNALREDLGGVYNYGYIGNKETISSDSYKKISVKVKVSEGAVAYVYLVDTDSENNDPYTYELPEYNFYYDDNGNILKEAADSKDTKAEADAKIVYKLRKDGLYEKDGKLYANFYNLTKSYDYKYEHESFFDENGKAVAFENLVMGKTYYANAEKTKYAPHYLVAGGKENNKVYEYCDGIGDNATYYYVEKGVTNKNKVVSGVDKTIARYTYDKATATPYCFTIDARGEEGKKYANKWITVTFNVHTGNVAKNYRLELWAGDRNEKQTAGVAENSYVLFDYSPEQETSLDSSTYTTKLGYYTNAIRADLIESIDGELPDNNQNIDQLKELAGANYNKIYNFDAMYYTFSLYDSSAFIPFNGETAEDGQTGYSYSYSDYDEALAFLKVEDLDDKNNCTMAAFVDYSVKDKAIDIIGEPTVDTGDDDKDDTTTANSTNVWLLAASIAVTAAIIIAMVALLIKGLVGKYGKKKEHVSKNSYNFNKNKRYVRKYVKANGDAPEATEGEANGENAEAEAPVESAEAPAEETPAENAETPVEETPTDNAEAPVEEAPAEGEQPAPTAETESEPAAPAENADGANGEEPKPESTDENKPE